MSRKTAPRRLRSLAVVVVVLSSLGLAVFSLSNLIPTSIRENVLGAPVTIPAEYVDLIRESATRCPAISDELFAAQLHAESSFDPSAESSAGAQGIAQFMPFTWKHYGIDGDGDGLVDVWNPADAIPSAARMNCINRKSVRNLDGPRLKNTFAAYNAGIGSVLKYGGIPPFPETEDYVEKIFNISKTINWP
jgi:soluble lytic murein transglycosylase-like protein